MSGLQLVHKYIVNAPSELRFTPLKLAFPDELYRLTLNSFQLIPGIRDIGFIVCFTDIKSGITFISWSDSLTPCR